MKIRKGTKITGHLIGPHGTPASLGEIEPSLSQGDVKLPRGAAMLLRVIAELEIELWSSYSVA
jgi:hypothetical protein